MTRLTFKAIIFILFLASSGSVKAQSTVQNGPVIKVEKIRVPGSQITKIDKGWDLGVLPITWEGELVISNVGNEPIVFKNYPSIVRNIEAVFPKESLQPGNQAKIIIRHIGDWSYGKCWGSIKNLSNSANYKNKYLVSRITYQVIDPLDVAVIERKGKWGCVNLNNQTVIPFEYEMMQKEYYDPIKHPEKKIDAIEILAKKSSKWGTIDRKNNVIIPLVYDTIEGFFEEGTLKVKRNGKWGVLDRNNSVIVSAEYDYIESRIGRDGVTAVVKDGKCGYVDGNNRIIIPLKYESVERIMRKEGVAAVKMNGKWGLVDRNNRLIIPFEYEDIDSQILDGVVKAKKNGKWGCVEASTNKIVVSFEYEDINLQIVGESAIAVAKKNGKLGLWGSTDVKKSNAQIEIPFEYEDIDAVLVEEGYVKAKKRGKWGVVDRTNHIIIPFEYDDIFSEMGKDGFVAIKNGKCGIIGKNNRIVVPFEYEEIEKEFSSKGTMRAKKNGLWGTIDRNNRVVKPFGDKYRDKLDEIENQGYDNYLGY